MVVDSSALLSIFYKEDDAELIEAKMDRADRLFMSTPTLVEVWVSVLRKLGRDSAVELEELVARLFIEAVDFNEQDVALAREAYVTFGRSLHPAKLNLGDCFSYALAMRLGEPLLFKGNDFSQTDVLKA
jgi:ribonuclease VapC